MVSSIELYLVRWRQVNSCFFQTIYPHIVSTTIQKFIKNLLDVLHHLYGAIDVSNDNLRLSCSFSKHVQL